MNPSTLRQKYNDWMDDHFDPLRKATGTISVRKGVIRYDLPSNMGLLLGSSIVNPAEEFRSGSDVPFIVKNAVKNIVERWDINEILRFRRDQALSSDIKGAIRHAEKFGAAPNGKGLREYAQIVLKRMNQTYGVTTRPTGEAGQLLQQILPMSPNELRRARHKRRAS